MGRLYYGCSPFYGRDAMCNQSCSPYILIIPTKHNSLWNFSSRSCVSHLSLPHSHRLVRCDRMAHCVVKFSGFPKHAVTMSASSTPMYLPNTVSAGICRGGQIGFKHLIAICPFRPGILIQAAMWIPSGLSSTSPTGQRFLVVTRAIINLFTPGGIICPRVT